MSGGIEKTATTSAAAREGRAAWSAPVLRTLGDLSALTQKVDNVGKSDGGTGSMKRT